MRYALPIVSLCLLLCSCEEPLDLGSNIPSQIILQSQIQAGYAPEIRIHVVNGFGETLPSSAVVEAEVLLQPELQNAEALAIIYIDDTSAIYSAPELAIKADTRYTLTIKTPGFADIRSTTDVPANVALRDSPPDNTGPNGGILPSGDIFHLPFAFDDPPGEDNFYHLVATVRDAALPVDNSKATPIAFGLRNRPSDARLVGINSWIFSDRDFVNGAFSTEIMLPLSGVQNLESPVVTMELRNVSINYFNYHIQSSRPKTGNLPDHSSSLPIDNVAGGSGLFGGFSAVEAVYKLEN